MTVLFYFYSTQVLVIDTGRELANFLGSYFCAVYSVMPLPEPVTPTLPETLSGLWKMLGPFLTFLDFPFS